ncbi:MAG: Peptidase S8/S53 subtilisin kexin sedolisin [Nitrosopumilales archaeon]|nr:MAG: Peptidase S8/S53 subtilisin kexin sedolisin [Nitrosopumilales archaeon]
MKFQKFIILFSVLVINMIIGVQFFENQSDFQTYLDKSGPYIGTKTAIESGFDGTGITIAVIDTGVDYNHPDLFGLGDQGKVIGGYDYIDKDSTPIDTSGHGTEVAGIIAADGQLKGIAPKSKILAYRVSDDGNSVSSDLIIKAIEQAIVDGADIINISLGINRTNQKIDNAVNKAIDQGILVVTAAGNNGPELGTIGSPGLNPNAITVGATYNNISSSLVSTLEVGDQRFQVLPMVGTKALDEPIIAEILFGKYSRERDLEGTNVENSILLVERGSDVEDEIVYFSDKEHNAATAGAQAIVVYNSKPGIFLGELTHELAGPNYQPSIPALSMSNKDGLMLRELLKEKTIGTLNVFYNPDFVAFFSSRGPVSPFYIKPDLVAPGVFVNTTLNDGKYNFTSGTSFAAPHVTGAAALLLQKEPDLEPNDIKSILVTTSDSVSDAYGNKFPFEFAGTGRLNLTKAFNANLIIYPTYLTFNLSQEKQSQTQMLEIKSLEKTTPITVSFEGDENIHFEQIFENEDVLITASLNDDKLGKFVGRVILENDGVTYTVPILVYVTKGIIIVNDEEGKLNFQISYPEDWSYARISVINKETGKIDTTSVTPKKDSSITVFEPGEYWIESKISSDGNTIDVYETIQVKTASTSKEFSFFDSLDIPERPILIIFAFIVVIALVGLKIRNR